MAMRGTERQGAVVGIEAGRRDDARRHGGGNGRRGGPEQVAKALGWFSIGLGVAELVMPGPLVRTLGLPGRGVGRAMTRLAGAREIASGIGILRERRPVGWLWARVVGDMIDLALLGAGFAAPRANRARLAAASAGVLGVTALDALCADQLQHASRLSVRAEPGGTLRIRKRITVNRPAEALYRLWRDFTNHPRFMQRVESVQTIAERRTRWRARGPAGAPVEWEAEVTDDRPNELIAWRSLDRGPFQHAGVVRFEPAPGGRGTVVTVEMEYTPRGGMLAAAAAKLIGMAPEQQLQEDLRRFKQLAETGQVVQVGRGEAR